MFFCLPLFFLCYLAQLTADQEAVVPDSGYLTNLENEPSIIVGGCVNVITGEYINQEVDLTAPGPQKLVYGHSFVNNNSHPRFSKKGPWQRQSFTTLKMRFWDKRYVFEHYGDWNDYHYFEFKRKDLKFSDYDLFKAKAKHRYHREAHVPLKALIRGVTNTSKGYIGSQTNIRNTKAFYNPKNDDAKARLRLADGTQIFFQRTKFKNDQFYFEQAEKWKYFEPCLEKHPNRLEVHYAHEYSHHTHKEERYLKNGLGQVLSSIKSDRTVATAPDGRFAIYNYSLTCLDIPYHVEGTHQYWYCLNQVTRSDAPSISYEYLKSKNHAATAGALTSPVHAYDDFEYPKLSKKSYPEGRYQSIWYYQLGTNYVFDKIRNVQLNDPLFCRVSHLVAPLGTDTNPVIEYQFDYYLPHEGKKEGSTIVYNAKGIQTFYQYNDHHRLTAITKCFSDGTPYTVENLFWGLRDSPEELELKTRTFGVAGQPLTFCRQFSYTKEGNINEDRLYGNLTGKEAVPLQMDGNGNLVSAPECFIKSFTYTNNALHLMQSKQEGPRLTVYSYLPDTNLMIASLESENGRTYLRHFYDYNANGMVIRHIIDDGCSADRNNLTGVTHRKIELTERSSIYPAGLPLEVKELFLDLESGTEILGSRQVNVFDTQGNLIKQTIFDSTNSYASTEAWTYDFHGNLLAHIDKLGQISSYIYDSNDNCTLVQGANPLTHKEYIYDFMNRLIREDEHHSDGILSKHYRYDLCSNQISHIDSLGNETFCVYDEFNRPIAINGAPLIDASGQLYVPTTRYQYDELSKPVKITDHEGKHTQFKYTLYGKPYHILYADGTEESFEYDLEGRLVKEISKNETSTLYENDCQGRVIHKRVMGASGELLYETRATFDTFHLLSEIDPGGFCTTYHYDTFGRKISANHEGHLLEFTYDSLGRLYQTIEGDTVKAIVYDALNRIIEERVEDLQGTTLTCSRYGYDCDGNRTLIEQQTDAGLSITEIHYDTHGIPVLTIDPAGNKTQSRLVANYFNEQGQRVACRETIDPLGQTHLVIFDAQGRLVEEIKKNSFGQTIQKSKHIISAAGHKLKTLHTVYAPNNSVKEISSLWEYDAMYRPIVSVQAAGTPDEKRYTTRYNSYGQKEAVTKPDGVSLLFQYDPLGRLQEFSSTDRSFHYRYAYDLNSRPIKVENLLDHSVSLRTYSAQGHLIKEKLSNGLSIDMSYTAEGKLAQLILPDQSAIHYQYIGSQLYEVSRLSPEKQTLYAHTYLKHDLSGRLTQSSLINNLGTIDYTYTIKGALASIKTALYSETNGYDACSNLVERTTTDFWGSDQGSYTYDNLYQLTSENGSVHHRYSSDSLYNRFSKDDNEYILNNLNQILSDSETTYTYDLCGNMILTEGPEGICSFAYDALDRLIKMQKGDFCIQYTYDENNRCMTRQEGNHLEKLLYHNQNDIGTWDQNLKHLRILGEGLGAEIGAAVAIEIDHIAYAPLHDHNGNLIALIDAFGNQAASYRYTAFGEIIKIQDSVGNPWRFASKRQEGDYLLFGRRFYSPKLGRWLTPDPIGLEGGPNLYAYVLNNPLTHFDLYGLLDGAEGNFWDRSIDFFASLWNSCKEVGRAGLGYIGEAVRKAGACLSAFSRNIIPIPIIKDSIQITGHFLQYGTFAGYLPSWSGPHSYPYKCWEEPNPNPYPLVSACSINGIATDLFGAIDNARLVSHAYGGIQVYAMFNNTGGFATDLSECSIQKMGIITNSVQKAVSNIRFCIQEVGGPGNNGIVKVDAYSQGGLILSCALDFLNPQEQSMLVVTTWGSASLIRPEGLLHCTNYVSNADPIPLMSDPLSYIAARLGLRDDVKFLPSNSLIEHSFSCETYQKQLKVDADYVQKSFFNR